MIICNDIALKLVFKFACFLRLMIRRNHLLLIVPAISICIYLLWSRQLLLPISVIKSAGPPLQITDDFSKARHLASDLLNSIYHRYDFHNTSHAQFFPMTWNIPKQGWDILKYKLASRIVQKANGAPFIMVFGGTGVTAGYDNYFNQSYPIVFQSRMSPLFTALNIKLIVRNIAQQHVGCRLANYCFESMGALKDNAPADFIGWENSFSCGSAKDVFEHIARIAHRNKAVIHYSASGGFSTINCKPSQVCGCLRTIQLGTNIICFTYNYFINYLSGYTSS